MIDAVFKYRTLLQWLACVVVSLLNTLAKVTLKRKPALLRVIVVVSDK